MSQAFHPLTLPLNGSRLIEASAGTGKTYTIEMLYLRLVLGHGADTLGGARGWMPPELLVVTFTNAATLELRERIRARLAQAARCFRDAHGERDFDANLVALREDFPEDARAACARRLELAAEWMDEAAISTIHAWCNRMLREHAFDSGSLFSQRLETDQQAMLDEVVRDYWRAHVWSLPLELARELRQWWPTPAALLADLRAVLPHVEACAAACAPAESMALARERRLARLAELKTPWHDGADELLALLDAARDRKAFHGTKLKQNNYRDWLAAMRDWAADAEMAWPAIKRDAKMWERLTPQGLAEVWKGEPPEHPTLASMAALPSALAALPDARADVMRHAAVEVAQGFDRARRERAEMGFDQLLADFSAALAGLNGERLGARVRAQFPVALIDEFQDTDPLQYRIFDAIYRVGQPCPERALIFIGDPKQAIYSFRGADIQAYLAARIAVGEARHTLDTNHRSVPDMVGAVNTVFGQAEAETGAVFRFAAKGENPVPFVAVGAAGRESARLMVEGATPALTLWHLPPGEDGKPGAKEATRTRVAAACADEVARLLVLAADGAAGFRDGDSFRPVRPADIALLVNSGGEAATLRAALAERGVRSVYLSERASVLDSPCALDLQHWLAACASPDDSRALRAALATGLLGLDWAALDAVRHDERVWDEHVMQFRAYNACWRSQGVLPMLRRLLHDFGVPARLLAQPDGERHLTDVLHLAELLQQAAATIDGEHALVRHFATLRRERAEDGEAQRVRLESDAELVKVVTVHKSKGLEYPLVFVPFAWDSRPRTREHAPLRVHDAHGGIELLFEPDDAAVRRADEERLAEDVRKLYVALTRARHATWLVLAEASGFEASALASLMAGLSVAERLARWEAPGHVQVALLPEGESGVRLAGPAAPSAPGEARKVTQRVSESWWIASYSALRLARAEAAETAHDETLREALDDAIAVEAAAPERTVPRGIHAFARGAAPGTFLHGLLEWAAEFGFGRLAGAPDTVRETVERLCAPHGWGAHVERLTRWLIDYVATPLPLPDGGEVALAGLDAERIRPELEFWIAARGVDVRRLDALVCRHTLGGVARPPLDAPALDGMLKGFIDLVFEHNGCYYVADYKSNWLGPSEAAYTAERMRETVIGKRYDMQYVLYIFALHRLLSARLPNYDYARHVGGAVYGFLRGAAAPTRGVHAECPPFELIAALDALFTGEEVGA